MDKWEEENIKSVLEKGNKKANEKYKVDSDYVLNEKSSQLVRNVYIASKYTNKPFVMPQEKDSKNQHMGVTVNAGVLKIEIIEGKNLSAKDINGKRFFFILLFFFFFDFFFY